MMKYYTPKEIERIEELYDVKIMTAKEWEEKRKKDDPKAEYYISTGSRGKMYTLRLRGKQKEDSFDQFISILTSEKESSIQKAYDYCGKILTIDFDVDEIAEKSAINHEIFQGGKYRGTHYLEVIKDDSKYIVFLIENMISSKIYRKTLQFCLMDGGIANSIDSRNRGLVEYIIQGEIWKKEKEEAERLREEKKSKINYYNGDIVVNEEVEVISQFNYESAYGLGTITTFTNDNHCFVTFGVAKVKVGDIVVIEKAKIKDKKEYKGMKQTIIKNIKFKK